MENGLELRISLLKSSPEIFRSVRISASTNLNELHWIIQDIFSWENFHIHEFNIRGTVISADREEKIRLSQFIKAEGAKFHYTYDFVNKWIHEIIVLRSFKMDHGSNVIICVDGARNSPPEDSGGVQGFQERLAILSNPQHPEHDWVKEWTEEFDPDYFDIRELNARLI